MFCPNCGSQNDDNANNCANCGAPLNVGSSQSDTVQQQPQQPQQTINTGATGSGEPKSKMVAGLLAIFVGSLGVHDFYLGNTKNGVIKLCLTLIGGWCFGIGALAAAVWAIIEGVQILTGKITTDANGVPLKE